MWVHYAFRGNSLIKKLGILVAVLLRGINHILYTCQLFLKYRHEIFILGVLGFLKMTRSFPNIPKEVRRLPNMSVCDISGNSPLISQSQSWNAYKRELAPSAFHFKNQRSRRRYCHLFILHTVFVPYMGLS